MYLFASSVGVGFLEAPPLPLAPLPRPRPPLPLPLRPLCPLALALVCCASESSIVNLFRVRHEFAPSFFGQPQQCFPLPSQLGVGKNKPRASRTLPLALSLFVSLSLSVCLSVSVSLTHTHTHTHTHSLSLSLSLFLSFAPTLFWVHTPSRGIAQAPEREVCTCEDATLGGKTREPLFH